MLAAATAMVDDWEVNGTPVLTDFEGENLGWGGELLCAQFLPTFAIDPTTLRPCTSPPASQAQGVCA